MIWNEQDHPRDDDGKFTFKNNVSNNNSNSQTNADILYGKNIRKEKEEKERRNELLNKLKDKLSPAKILYSTNEELEKMMANEKITGGASGIKNSQTDIFTAPVTGKIRSEYGLRNAPIAGASTFHKGIDIAVPVGTSVGTITSGTVIKAGEASGYGKAVYIDHGIINGKHVVSEYGHLSNINVKVGDKIKQGQVIAKSGNSGYSTGPHLHLTIKENGKAVNPRKYVNLY